MAATIQPTDETVRNNDQCGNGTPGCGGPDDDLPCFACYCDLHCPHGRDNCANRAAADGGAFCRRCALVTGRTL